MPPSYTPWMVVGDLNEVTNQGEKSGGCSFHSSQYACPLNFMDLAGISDLGFNGNPYIWTNAGEGVELIQERLDRALASSRWLDILSQTQVTHLPFTHSDHFPLLMSLHDNNSGGPYPFRGKEAWSLHDDFKSFFVNHWSQHDNNFLLGQNSLHKSISSWNTNIFGNLTKQGKIILKRLDGIQYFLAYRPFVFLSNLESTFFLGLNRIHKIKRFVWAQKAGLDWRKFLDYNNKYLSYLS